jgi:lysophospholipase L1-like esterase
MPPCLVFGAVALALSGVLGLLLSDGRVRREAHFMLARRFGGVFEPRLVVAGDSLAAACPWRELDRRPFAVLNLAEGGATLKEIAGQVYRARQFEGARLLIDGGLNDLLFDQAPLAQFERDSRALFNRIGAHRQVIFTLMPFTAELGDPEMIEAANALLVRQCVERGSHALDINGAVSQGRRRKPEMTNDGLHFTRAAEMKWIEATLELLE